MHCYTIRYQIRKIELRDYAVCCIECRRRKEYVAEYVAGTCRVSITKESHRHMQIK